MPSILPFFALPQVIDSILTAKQGEVGSKPSSHVPLPNSGTTPNIHSPIRKKERERKDTFASAAGYEWGGLIEIGRSEERRTWK